MPIRAKIGVCFAVAAQIRELYRIGSTLGFSPHFRTRCGIDDSDSDAELLLQGSSHLLDALFGNSPKVVGLGRIFGNNHARLPFGHSRGPESVRSTEYSMRRLYFCPVFPVPCFISRSN